MPISSKKIIKAISHLLLLAVHAIFFSIQSGPYIDSSGNLHFLRNGYHQNVWVNEGIEDGLAKEHTGHFTKVGMHLNKKFYLQFPLSCQHFYIRSRVCNESEFEPVPRYNFCLASITGTHLKRGPPASV